MASLSRTSYAPVMNGSFFHLPVFPGSLSLTGDHNDWEYFCSGPKALFLVGNEWTLVWILLSGVGGEGKKV